MCFRTPRPAYREARRGSPRHSSGEAANSKHWLTSELRGSMISTMTRAALFAFFVGLMSTVLLTSVSASAVAGSCANEEARAERGSLTLPDCRAYELMTPPGKNAATVGEGSKSLQLTVAADGRHAVTTSAQCFGHSESCTAIQFSHNQPYEFERTPGGWITRPLAPSGVSYEASTWTVATSGGAALFAVPSAPESLTSDFLARESDGSLKMIGPLAEHPGEAPYHELAPNYRALASEPVIATADLSHVVYETSVPTWSFDDSDAEGEIGYLYEYAGPAHAPLLVGVSGGFESHALISRCGTGYGTPPGEEQARRRFNALSEDGRVIIFAPSPEHSHGTACTGPSVDELYARIDGEDSRAGFARSVPVSVDPPAVACSKEPCEHNAAHEFEDAAFEGASQDGSRVFFTDTQQLTDNASQSAGSAVLENCNKIGTPGGCNLYEWECAHCDELAEAQEAEQQSRRLVDVSEGEGGAIEEGPRVQGVIGIAPDGSYVYFVAKGVLTGSEANEAGEHAEEGADNLYVYSGGHRRFIAQLSPVNTRIQPAEFYADEFEWKHNDGVIANVSPDGTSLVFTSHRALTGGVTCEETETNPCPSQVYEYDALSGRLTRVSIGDDGFNDDGNGGQGNASIVPALTEDSTGVPIRTDPSMSDNGEYVFFQSPIALTEGALNDVAIPEPGSHDEGLAQNVYEYHAGHVYLISDGRDTTPTGGGSDGAQSPVELLGSDASGGNVFFSTFDQLVPEDTDTQRDFYDARVCSEAEPCMAPVRPGSVSACGEETCQGQPSSVASGPSVPGSEAFAGLGEPPLVLPSATISKPKPLTLKQRLTAALKSCRKKKNKHQRKVCEASARKRFVPAHKSAKPARKTSHGAKGR
jgi:WD40-like Beta Propeller Repeat